MDTPYVGWYEMILGWYERIPWTYEMVPKIQNREKATTKKAHPAVAAKAAEPKTVTKALKVKMKAAPKVGGKRYKRLFTQSAELIRKMFKKH